MSKKYIVTLTEAERAELRKLISTGNGAARRLAHARVLLKADQGLTDERIAVEVEVTPQFFSDRIREVEDLRRRLEQALEQAAGIRIKVNLVKLHTIERSQGKAKRVLDQRNETGEQR